MTALIGFHSETVRIADDGTETVLNSVEIRSGLELQIYLAQAQEIGLVPMQVLERAAAVEAAREFGDELPEGIHNVEIDVEKGVTWVLPGYPGQEERLSPVYDESLPDQPKLPKPQVVGLGTYGF